MVDEVQFIIWGATSKLVTEGDIIRDVFKKVREKGVKLIACRACVAKLGLLDKFEEFGIKTAYMGMPLTEALKNEERLLTAKWRTNESYN